MTRNPIKARLFATACIALFNVSVAATATRAQEADVIHWWTSGAEAKAVKVIADSYGKAGGTWIDSAVVGGPAARAAAINRIAGGNPPTAMQCVTWPVRV
jgi:glucose/mannose transport system substrate-binding protein